MEDSLMLNNGEEHMYLPPGFRFYPTDEEITYYLSEKVTDPNFTAHAIGEVDLNKCEPWDLPRKAKMGEKEWYFFCKKDRKYPTGSRTNRATESGYWKATGKDKMIHKGKGELVGMKKTLVFYRGRAPNGKKTNWVMHEFRLEGSFISLSCHSQKSLQKEEWVVCKIFNKSITQGECSQNMNSCNIEAPVIDPIRHNPDVVSPNYNAMTQLSDLPSLSPTPDNVSLGHMKQQEELVRDATQWYHNSSHQLYDDQFIFSNAMMDTNTHTGAFETHAA